MNSRIRILFGTDWTKMTIYGANPGSLLFWSFRGTEPFLSRPQLRTVLIMKRGRKDQLTGGSGDVNPQIISVIVNQTANDASTSVIQPIPIPRLPTKEGKNLVIELLGVEYFDPGIQSVPGVGVVQRQLVILTTTSSISPSITTALAEPRQLSQWFRAQITATLVGIVNEQVYFYDDLTDGAGHGLLLATDQYYLQSYSENTAITNTTVVKIYYRWKEVSLVEYIGIVQSQQ